MADQKITELDELTTPVSTDLLPIVEDPGGTPKTEKITLERLGLTNGWFPITKTLVYAAADDPTFTFTIAAFDATAQLSPGMKIKLTNATVKYFIITKVVFDDPGSTITVYGGTDYNLVDAAITSPFYSTQKAPLDFPLDPDKWTVELKDTGNRTQNAPVIATWYNLGSISIDVPVGVWNVEYSVLGYVVGSAVTVANMLSTLSTANNSSSDATWNVYMWVSGASGDIGIMGLMQKYGVMDLATKDTFYLNGMKPGATAAATIGFYNVNQELVLKAVCAFL